MSVKERPDTPPWGMADAPIRENDSVLPVPLSDCGSRMFYCTPWNGVHLWANLIRDEYLPYVEGSSHRSRIIINFCISGRCEVELPGENYIYMEPGSLCLSTEEPSGGYRYPGGAYTGVEIGLDRDILSDHAPAVLSDLGLDMQWLLRLLDQNDGTRLLFLPNHLSAQMTELFQQLCAAADPVEEYRFSLLRILRALKRGVSKPYAGKSYVTKGQREIANAVEKTVMSDLSAHVTVADMAAEHGVSPSAVKKYFAAVFGLPISEYLKERRMEQAMDLLSATRKSVGEIAAACGYSNQGKFGTAFKTRTGSTPLEYRRRTYKKTQCEK